MKTDMRKVTLAAMTAFCFWVTFERIRDFYVETFPIGQEGSCYAISYPGNKNTYQMKIIRNINQSQKSEVNIRLIPPHNGEPWSDTYSYFQLRMLNPKSMGCL